MNTGADTDFARRLGIAHPAMKLLDKLEGQVRAGNLTLKKALAQAMLYGIELNPNNPNGGKAGDNGRSIISL